ncbi:hypothetical protein B566_EDAN012781, partial [Ephemera danica]
PAIKKKGHRTPVTSPAQETKEVAPALEFKPEILFSKMSSEMENWAINICSAAFVLKTDAMSKAKYICDFFEKQYGESWHCVVGSDFGNFARYEDDSYIHLKIANQRLIVYKTPDSNEIVRLQDLLLEQRLEFEELNKRLEKENAELNKKLEMEIAELKEEKIALSTELQNLEIKIKSLSDLNEKFKQIYLLTNELEQYFVDAIKWIENFPPIFNPLEGVVAGSTLERGLLLPFFLLRRRMLPYKVPVAMGTFAGRFDILCFFFYLSLAANYSSQHGRHPYFNQGAYSTVGKHWYKEIATHLATVMTVGGPGSAARIAAREVSASARTSSGEDT